MYDGVYRRIDPSCINRTLLHGDDAPNKTAIKLQATVNVISAKHVDINNVTSSGVKLKMYNNTSLTPLGKCLFLLQTPANGKKHCGISSCRGGLHPSTQQGSSQGITVNYSNFSQLQAATTKCDALTEEFKSVFDAKTLGCLNRPDTLRTDDATRPVKCPPRPVPIAMQTKLRYELDGLAGLKVIIPVTEPTEWCSQISVQTKKSGRLRICIDPDFSTKCCNGKPIHYLRSMICCPNSQMQRYSATWTCPMAIGTANLTKPVVY